MNMRLCLFVVVAVCTCTYIPEDKDGLVSWSPGQQGAEINLAACNLAREVADEGNALVAGGVSQTPSYLSCKSNADVKAIFQKQLDVFTKKDVDFLIAEVRCPAARKGKKLDAVKPTRPESVIAVS